MQELTKLDERLEKQSRELAAQIWQRPPHERESLRRQLAELVEQHFEVRQKQRELALQRLTEHLERIRATIARRNELRPAIVEQRIRDLLGQPPDLDF
jgi:hypothetical protein